MVLCMRRLQRYSRHNSILELRWKAWQTERCALLRISKILTLLFRLVFWWQDMSMHWIRILSPCYKFWASLNQEPLHFREMRYLILAENKICSPLTANLSHWACSFTQCQEKHKCPYASRMRWNIKPSLRSHQPKGSVGRFDTLPFVAKQCGLHSNSTQSRSDEWG